MEIDLLVVYSVQLWAGLHGGRRRLKQICTETQTRRFAPVSSLRDLIVENFISL